MLKDSEMLPTPSIQECFILVREYASKGYSAPIHIMLESRTGAVMFFRSEQQAETLRTNIGADFRILRFSRFSSSESPKGSVTKGLLFSDEQFERYVNTRDIGGLVDYVFEVKF